MNQLNLIAVPNGVFSLEEAIDDTLIQNVIQQLQKEDAPTTTKIKAFLTVYQMIDTLAQMHMQGLDIEQVNQFGLAMSMKDTIDLGYDSIMKTFTNHERKRIHDLVQKAPAH
ncbi:hypothetical protein [Aquitalea pelogenes]|uniref:hypothetical protein n=1 Tax=Aquitalea pelogenes TaxID=1293573 RepID=UPI0035B09F9F